MALTRKFLSALGIEQDKVDEIIENHTDTVDALKKERDKYRADSEKLESVQKELDELKAAKKDGDSFEVKYKAIKEEFENYKQDVAKKETAGKKEAAYRALLRDVGVSEKRIDAVLKVTSLDDLTLDEKGCLEGSADLKKAIKTEWADFIVSEGRKGAETETPPSGTGKTYKDKAEIMAIKDTAERQKAIAENLNLFEQRR